MKIAVVTPWYPSEGRPVSGLFVQREVEAFAGAGHDVRVVYLDRDLEPGQQVLELSLGAPILHIGMDPSNPLSVLKAIGPLRRATAFAEVVNTHAISALPVALAARFDKPWVHTEHWSALSSPQATSPLLRLVRPAFGALLRAPDVAVAESQRLANAIRAFRGAAPVELIPCIVASPKQLAELPSRDQSRPIRLMSTGGVIERKGPLLAVRTLAALRDLGVAAQLRWVGEGEQRQEAEELAAQLGVDAQFLGACPPEVVERELAWADMFIGPTQGENFFVAAAEALVNGRPIVASDQGGHTEYADRRFAEIVESRDPRAYAEAVVRMWDKMRGATAEEIARTVSVRFSPVAVAQQYKNLYENLI